MYGFRESDQSYGEMVVWISAGCQVNNMKNDSILVKCPFAVPCVSLLLLWNETVPFLNSSQKPRQREVRFFHIYLLSFLLKTHVKDHG